MVHKTNRGIARFESGRGNTMEIIFPKVIQYNFKAADFYNERAKFLYSNKINPKKGENREIRLIYQDDFDEILEKKGTKATQYDCILKETIDVLFDLHDNSKLMTNKVTGSQFKKMLADSNLKNGIYGDKDGNNKRKEQAALFLFDTEKLEIWLEIQEDSKNGYTVSYIRNSKESSIDKKAIWKPNSIEMPNTQPGNEKVMIIATIHTHPINYLGEENFGYTEKKTNFHTPDIRVANEWNIPFFHLYPETINEVDLIIPKQQNIENICTTKELLLNKFDIVRKALEINGKLIEKL